MMKKHGVPSVILAIVLLLIPVLSACTSNNNPTTTTSSPPPTTPASTALLPTVAGVDATLLFVSKCSVCHGLNLQGGPAGPNITDTSNFSAAFLSTFLSVHPAPGMSPALRDILADYLKINSKPASTTGAAFSTDPAVIFASNCALCHGASRTGGLGGPDITAVKLTNFGTEAQLSTFISAHFTGVDLSQDRRALLAHYLKTAP
jgi:mono/diheme cytochrome c family protein